jgi:hypothetical protein
LKSMNGDRKVLLNTDGIKLVIELVDERFGLEISNKIGRKWSSKSIYLDKDELYDVLDSIEEFVYDHS